MARLGRTFLPDQPLDVVQRGNNRGATVLLRGRLRPIQWLAREGRGWLSLPHPRLCLDALESLSEFQGW